MAIPKGLFDATLIPAGWFDETALAAGWFDADLLDVAAGGGATATLSWAEGAETSAISATAGQNITLAWTEAGDSLAANVNASQSAGLSWSENSETQSIAANVGTSSATAALAWIEQSESWTVNAAASVSASASWSEISDNASIAASVSQSLSLSWTDDGDSFALTGVVSAGGTLSPIDVSAIANAVWSKSIETLHADEMLRIMFAAIAGERSGIRSTTERYFSVDGVTPRITLTPDSNGNGVPILNGGTAIVPTAGSALNSTDLDNIANAVWGAVIETYKANEMMRVMFSGLAGGRSGLGGSTEHYFSVSGEKDRITFTPIDANGNGLPVIDVAL